MMRFFWPVMGLTLVAACGELEDPRMGDTDSPPPQMGDDDDGGPDFDPDLDDDGVPDGYNDPVVVFFDGGPKVWLHSSAIQFEGQGIQAGGYGWGDVNDWCDDRTTVSTVIRSDGQVFYQVELPWGDGIFIFNYHRDFTVAEEEKCGDHLLPEFTNWADLRGAVEAGDSFVKERWPNGSEIYAICVEVADGRPIEANDLDCALTGIEDCDDGVDNDLDGKVDGADPDCDH